MYHLPGEYLHQAKELDEAYKDSGIHNLAFGLVGLEEFNAGVDGSGNKYNCPYPDKNNYWQHLPVVEIFYH